MVVAKCEAADGKPAATIKWMGEVGGTENTTSKKGLDGTVTVMGEYLLVPTPEDNGKEVTCMISQRTQDKPQIFPMKLSVECKCFEPRPQGCNPLNRSLGITPITNV